MKSIVKLFVVAFVTFVFAGAGMAQGTGPTGGTGAKSSTPAKSEKKAAAAKVLRAKGELTAADAKAGTAKVKTKEKELSLTAETQEAKEYWRTSPRPEVRFFVDHCSGYGDSGGALITLAPFNFTNAAVRAMRTLGRNRLDRLLGRKHKFKTH